MKKQSLFSALIQFDGAGIYYSCLDKTIKFNTIDGGRRAFINACNKMQLSGTLRAWFGPGEKVNVHAYLISEAGANDLIFSATLKAW